MEIILRNGEHEVIVRDKRPIVEPDVAAAFLTAAREALAGGGDTEIVLPFGFTKIVGDEDGDDEETPEGDD